MSKASKIYISKQTSKTNEYDLHGTSLVCFCSSWTNLFRSTTACSLIMQLESELHLEALSSREIHSINGMGAQFDSIGQSQLFSDSTTTGSSVITDVATAENCGIPSTRRNIWCRYGQMHTCRNSSHAHNWWPALSYKIFKHNYYKCHNRCLCESLGCDL